MKKYSILSTVLFLLLTCFFVFSVNITLAAEGLLPEKASSVDGDYTLNEMMQVFVNVSEWILGIVGSLALIMFIYGGFMFLISSGNTEKVTQAKQIIVGAVVGLVIVFTSYMIINFVAHALGIQGGGILQSNWFQNK